MDRNPRGADSLSSATAFSFEIHSRDGMGEERFRSRAYYAKAPEAQLLAAAKTGDREAFAEMFSRSKHIVFRRVLKILRNREDTEDAVQEACAKACMHLDGFRGTCAFSTWLLAIAINAALMHLRRSKVRREFDLIISGDEGAGSREWELPDHSLNPEEHLLQREAGEELVSLVGKLPIRFRSVIELTHFQDQSLRQVSECLNISQSSAKTRLFRARRALQSKLKRQHLRISRSSVP